MHAHMRARVKKHTPALAQTHTSAHANEQVQGDVPLNWSVWPGVRGKGRPAGAGDDGRERERERDKSVDCGAFNSCPRDVVDLSSDSPQTAMHPEVTFVSNGMAQTVSARTQFPTAGFVPICAVAWI
jgi:hypothetical protein